LDERVSEFSTEEVVVSLGLALNSSSGLVGNNTSAGCTGKVVHVDSVGSSIDDSVVNLLFKSIDKVESGEL